MDRADLSSAIRQEMHGVVEEALEALVPELLTMDLALLEQRVQQVDRLLLGPLSARVAAGHAQLLPRPGCCSDCGGKLKRQERTRQLVGLGGTMSCSAPTIGVPPVSRARRRWRRRWAWVRAPSPQGCCGWGRGPRSRLAAPRRWSRGRRQWAPQTQVWLVPRGFTAITVRPAPSTLPVRIAMNCAHAASLIALARQWFCTMFVMARSSW
jgi:hypothetical protein